MLLMLELGIVTFKNASIIKNLFLRIPERIINPFYRKYRTGLNLVKSDIGFYLAYRILDSYEDIMASEGGKVNTLAN